MAWGLPVVGTEISSLGDDPERRLEMGRRAPPAVEDRPSFTRVYNELWAIDQQIMAS